MDYQNLCLGCFSDKGRKNPCSTCGYEEKPIEASIYLPPRTILAEKHITGKVLGQGGFGITYLGWDKNLDRKLAIKEFFPQGMVSRLPGQKKVISFAEDEPGHFGYGLERFLKEAKTLARFEEHPNIVTVRDFFEANGTAYMVMNYIEGLTLEQYLRSKRGRISFEQALKIIMPVLDALKEVHEEGFMHRDISPDNILINKKGRVILIDFGAARQEMREKSKSLSVILKAGYAPEEQYRSRGKQGPWTDIYAAAATIYRCITGKVPFEAMDRLVEDDLVAPSQFGISINAGQEQALLKAMAVRAEERYQTVQQFQEELQREKVQANMTFNKAASAVTIAAKNAVKSLKAVYYIDYTAGSISLGDLPIGTRLVDPTWQWEFRTGSSYTGRGARKPAAWIIVAKNHYAGMDAHITLLSAELIGKYCFAESKKMFWSVGSNSWQESGTGNNAVRGLRPWLNSNGIHRDEGFYRAFSESFRSAVLTTIVPNREWQNGTVYSTEDKVFIPSTAELGDTGHIEIYPIGSVYPYFQGAGNAKRVAWLGSETRFYWTRTPDFGGGVRDVDTAGAFSSCGGYASFDDYGVRPALNLKSDIPVSEIKE